MSSIAPDGPRSPIQTADLAALIRAALIGARDVELDPVGMQDVLWLAAIMDAADHGSATPPSRRRIFRWFWRRRPIPRVPAGAANLPADGGEAGRAAGRGAVELYNQRDGGEGETKTVRGRRILLGGPRALQGNLELARALRPFRQSWPSHHRTTLDVEATIRASAAARQTLPILRPDTERRFSVDLVLDMTPSMLVWADAFAELAAVFMHVGAFRDVTTWELHADEDTVWLGRAGSRWPPTALRSADHRRVILVITDAVAERWYQPGIWQALTDWGACGPVALMDLLPLKLWNFSGIGSNRVRVRATSAAVANAELTFTPPRRWRLSGRTALSVMPMPVVELSAAAVAEWSGMVAAAHPVGNAAMLVESGTPVAAAGPRSHDSDSQATLRNFLHTASPEALRLAVLAATSDSTTLAVLRAIQQELLPESAVSDLAEVLVSGIFQRVPDGHGPDLRIRMNADCRAALQALASLQDRWDVYRAVTAAIRRVSPESAGSFEAAVRDPLGDITLVEGQQAFAEIARSALTQAAGMLADLARRPPVRSAYTEPRTEHRTKGNPFVRYGTLASDDRFIGRDLEREALRRRLYENRSSAALIGLNRMGKSSLAYQIEKEAPDEKTLTGWINIATLRSGAEALTDLLEMCPAETPPHATFTTASGAPATDGVPGAREIPIHDLYRMIRAALLRLGRSGGHLMVILDGFDSVKNFPDARDFLNLLRELVYYPDQIPMAVLAVARRPIDRIEVEAADISTFAGVCDSIYLRPMDYEQVKAMAARSADLAGDAPDVAWKYAAGHPFLSEVAFCRMLEYGVTDIGRIIQSDLSSYYKSLEDFLRREELWEALLKLAYGRGADVDVEEGALVRRYGLIDENGEVWSWDFDDYLRKRPRDEL